jgi:GntR family transcriptional regulator/MocR family aminotransferase
MAGGHFERHLNRMKKLYRQKRDAVIRAIRQSPLQGRFTIREEDAGLHFLLKLDTALTDEELRRRALEKGIRLSFLSDYQQAPTARSAHRLVISYAGIDTEKLPEVFALLAEMI